MADTRKLRKLLRKARKARQKLARSSEYTWEQKASFRATVARLKDGQAEVYRAAPTNAEKQMWPLLMERGFRRQFVVCGYIADFANEESKLILELDGSSHNDRRDYDAHRDQVLCHAGWNVLRFPNAVTHSDSGLQETLTLVDAALRSGRR